MLMFHALTPDHHTKQLPPRRPALILEPVRVLLDATLSSPVYSIIVLRSPSVPSCVSHM